MAGNKYQDGRKRDLEQRTFAFAQQVRRFVDRLPRTLGNYEDARQLVRASGSVAANYVESQEGLSRRDFFFRIRICRKEARESNLWLRMLHIDAHSDLSVERAALANEADELKRIFQSIAAKDDTAGA